MNSQVFEEKHMPSFQVFSQVRYMMDLCGMLVHNSVTCYTRELFIDKSLAWDTFMEPTSRFSIVMEVSYLSMNLTVKLHISLRKGSNNYVEFMT